MDENTIIIPPGFESDAWTMWWGHFEYVNSTTLYSEVHHVKQVKYVNEIGFEYEMPPYAH